MKGRRYQFTAHLMLFASLLQKKLVNASEPERLHQLNPVGQDVEHPHRLNATTQEISQKDLNTTSEKLWTRPDRRKMFDIEFSLENEDNKNKQQSQEKYADGLTDVDLQVVLGQEVRMNRYPYMCYLYIQYRGAGTLCGGTLISPDMVLTAAHCVPNGALDSISFAECGAHHRRDDPFGEKSEKIKIEKYYQVGLTRKGSLLYNDVAIFKLTQCSARTPVSLSCASPSWEFSGGKKCYVMGWGRQSYNEVLNRNRGSGMELQEVDLYIEEGCLSWGPYINNDEQVCAGKRNAGPCYGDSGGPLIIRGNNDVQDCQIGIVSFGAKCADAGGDSNEYPYVFARVSHHMSWISDIIRTRSSCNNKILNPLQDRNYKTSNNYGNNNNYGNSYNNNGGRNRNRNGNGNKNRNRNNRRNRRGTW